MLDRIALLGLMAVASTFFADPAPAQEDPFVGSWQQIQSNAGDCRKCRISIARSGASLNVVANNGWSAVVHAGGDRNTVEAAGTGAWAPRKFSAMAGRPFDVVFRLVDQRLYMSMRVPRGDGSERLIRGVFERPWAGV